MALKIDLHSSNGIVTPGLYARIRRTQGVVRTSIDIIAGNEAITPSQMTSNGPSQPRVVQIADAGADAIIETRTASVELIYSLEAGGMVIGGDMIALPNDNYLQDIIAAAAKRDYLAVMAALYAAVKARLASDPTLNQKIMYVRDA